MKNNLHITNGGQALNRCVHMNTHMSKTMENLTLSIPRELKKELQKHKEVNWSEVTRQAMQEHLRKIQIAEHIAQKSKLTKKDVQELERVIKHSLAKAHNV